MENKNIINYIPSNEKHNVCQYNNTNYYQFLKMS